MEEYNPKLCFIIAHKYYRNYESYIQYYVDNIQKFYTNSFIIIVDNNSKHIDDIKNKLANYSNLVILSNDTPCKFEIGAYNVGINYLKDNNLIDKYDFCIFSQDTYVLKNKYNFNKLYIDKTNALAFHAVMFIDINQFQLPYFYSPSSMSILKKINLSDKIQSLKLCWCNSFILHSSKIIEFLDITKDTIVLNRPDSECSERYLSGILYYLNNYSLADLCPVIDYDFRTIDIINSNTPNWFLKRFQQKNERTMDD